MGCGSNPLVNDKFKNLRSNMSLAVLFPGQGSQYVGMGHGLAADYTPARRVFEEANDLLSFNLSDLMWNGSESDLQLTKFAQPAILVHSIATFRVLEDLFDCELKNITLGGGHSLGEFSAHVAAKTMTFSDAIRTVQLRGELMQAACIDPPGTMAAIIGLDDLELESICETSSCSNNRCTPANFNSPGQTVISGDVDAVKKAMTVALDAGAKRVVELNVSGAFHSHLMSPATNRFAEWMDTITLNSSRFPIISNVTGKPPATLVGVTDLLVRQLTSPVLWAQSIRYMVENGVGTFLEIGPGSVLRGLNRRITKGTPCKSVGKSEDLVLLEEYFQRL